MRKTLPPGMIFDPRRLSLCIREVDGTIHILHPDAPGVSPWTPCRKEIGDGARFIFQVGDDVRVYVDLAGFKIDSPKLCDECLPHSDEGHARILGEHLRLVARISGEREHEALRHYLDTATAPASRKGRLGAIAVTLEALGKLRDYADSGAYSREAYDRVVDELRNEPREP